MRIRDWVYRFFDYVSLNSRMAWRNALGRRSLGRMT